MVEQGILKARCLRDNIGDFLKNINNSQTPAPPLDPAEWVD